MAARREVALAVLLDEQGLVVARRRRRRDRADQKDAEDGAQGRRRTEPGHVRTSASGGRTLAHLRPGGEVPVRRAEHVDKRDVPDPDLR
nr:hypothetical protein GCM10020092_105430 [Actinoplanes digitatis]